MMDWVIIVSLGILIICGVLIIFTLLTLPKLGDERKNFVKMKAQSFTFTVVIGMLLIEIVRDIFRTIWGDDSYGGMNPFSFLTAISVVYLVSLLITKKKYGG